MENQEKQGLTLEQYRHLQRPFEPTEISWWVMKSKSKVDENFKPMQGVNVFSPYLTREPLIKRLQEAQPFFSCVPENFDNMLLTTLSILVEGTWIRHADTGAEMTSSDKVSKMARDGQAVTFALKRVCQMHGIGLNEKMTEPVSVLFENGIFKFQNGKIAKSMDELKAGLCNFSINSYYLNSLYAINKDRFSDPEMMSHLKFIADNLK